MKIILQSCQEIHLDKFPISGINNLSANLLTRSQNNPTSERVPILPSMVTDFREFADDRRSWLTRDCSCCVWGEEERIPATASISRAARRTPVPITAASNWLCFSGQLESVRDQDRRASPTLSTPPRLATIDIPPPYRGVLVPSSRGISQEFVEFVWRKGFFSTLVTIILIGRWNHGAWRWEPIKGKNYAGTRERNVNWTWKGIIRNISIDIVRWTWYENSRSWEEKRKVK